MPESRASSVAGLIPAAVRIELAASQVSLLAHELGMRLEAIAAALRSDADHQRGPAPDALAEHAAELRDQHALLQALSDHRGDWRRGVAETVTVTLPTPAADELVRGCARRALDALREEIAARSG